MCTGLFCFAKKHVATYEKTKGSAFMKDYGATLMVIDSVYVASFAFVGQTARQCGLSPHPYEESEDSE